MQFSFTSILALTAALASASPLTSRSQGDWEFPESMRLVARQDLPEPGTPLYLCHENCGMLFTPNP